MFAGEAQPRKVNIMFATQVIASRTSQVLVSWGMLGAKAKDMCFMCQDLQSVTVHGHDVVGPSQKAHDEILRRGHEVKVLVMAGVFSKLATRNVITQLSNIQ